MKKKIINGILIVAALFATSTSFVSCKDNLADEVNKGFDQVAQQMEGLQGKISDVEGKIATLESSVLKNSEEIANLKTQLASLQNDLKALEAKVDKNTADIEALDKRLTALEDEVNSLMGLINNLAVGVTVRQTIDPVIGSINLPGYNPLFLAAYVGENLSGIAQFPFAGDKYNGADEYNVDPYGNELLPREIAVDPVWINDGDDDWNGLIMGYKHNAGTLYFTLNPIGLDASQLSFDLVNSLGTVSPVTIDNVQQSSYVNTPSIGHHGNGSESGDEAENPYLYSAEATIPLEANADLAWNKEVSSQMMLDKLNHDLSLLIAQVNAGYSAPSLVISSLDVLQNFYQNWYKNLTARQYQNLRVTYSDGNGTERIITSPENIVTATVSPLSYKTFWDLGGVITSGAFKFDDELLAGIAGKIFGAITSKLPDFPDITVADMMEDFEIPMTSIDGNTGIVVTTAEGEYVYSKGTGTEYKWWKVNGTQLEEIDGNLPLASVQISDFVKELEDAIKQGASQIDIQSKLDALKKQYTAVKNGNPAGLVKRAADYITMKANDIIKEFKGNPAFKAVTPIVLMDTNEGITRMYPEMTFTSAESEIPLILTSATEEYLVPAYKKYVAVLQGGKPVFAQLLDGSEKILNVEFPTGKSELIYSTIDYNGYVVTKRYPVTRNEK
ncbi:MAG: hypothetical protein J1E58_07025 [Prevotella sp.]|nr:hypothetical protein [Prevotella sp.]